LWRERFIIVFEGSIVVYGAATDLTPRRVILVQNAKIEEVPERRFKKKHAFAVKLDRGEEIVFVASDETDLKTWMDCITENFAKTPSPLPTKEFKLMRKSAAVYLTGKFAEKLTNMGVGGKIMRGFMSDETVIILDSFKNFLTQRLGADKANDIEKQGISIGIKIALLYRDKKIKPQALKPTRASIEFLSSKIIDGFEVPFTFSSVELIEAIKDVEKCLKDLMKPVLSENSINKMSALLTILSDEELLEDLFEKKKWKELELIATQLRELWDTGRL